MGQDSGFDNGTFKPLIAERVASPGKYVEELERSPFNNSRILRTAAFYIEGGRFAEGSDVIQAELVKRGVGFEYVSHGTSRRGTRVENGHEIMILEDDFKDQTPVKKLWSLLHRNMSLILPEKRKEKEVSSLSFQFGLMMTNWKGSKRMYFI